MARRERVNVAVDKEDYPVLQELAAALGVPVGALVVDLAAVYGAHYRAAAAGIGSQREALRRQARQGLERLAQLAPIGTLKP